jgi:hypothetical protein
MTRVNAPPYVHLAVAVLATWTVGLAQVGAAPPAGYQVVQVLIPPDEKPSSPQQVQAPVYKPHEIAIEMSPDVWIASNESTQFAGITLFRSSNNEVLAQVNIDEPGVQLRGVHEEGGHEQLPPREANTGRPTENLPTPIRLNPSVCLPVVLPPGTYAPVLDGRKVKPDPRDPNHRICAPLGAEKFSRFPHGVDIDKVRARAFQVIEHSGLKWNGRRSAFEVATTTEEEAGLLLMYDIRDPRKPRIVSGYLLGPGPFELAVNERNGLVFVGNLRDAPGVVPNIWVSVIDPSAPDPYGFIDTGWRNAVHGVEVDQVLNIVFGATEVGEKMFAFDGSCAPRPNARPSDEKRMGENCILYAVDVRSPFLEQVPEAETIFGRMNIVAEEQCLPAVLHLHDVTVDPLRHRVYLTVHAIQYAMDTGLPEERRCRQERVAQQALVGEPREETRVLPYFLGRWVAEVNADAPSRDFKKVSFIDLSNNQDALKFPTAMDIPEHTPFEKQFVHAHWVAVDPLRKVLLVTGEETGNLAVVDASARKLVQVIAISKMVPGSKRDGVRPHVHGVQINELTGRAYVSDEGQAQVYYESVTILKPKPR